MNLTFIGTRGEIDARTRRHRMHTSLLVSYRSANVMIDCGLDWLGKLKRVSPSAIVRCCGGCRRRNAATIAPTIARRRRNRYPIPAVDGEDSKCRRSRVAFAQLER